MDEVSNETCLHLEKNKIIVLTFINWFTTASWQKKILKKQTLN